mmetsp:Transcript_8776/g.35859  ORF Transcript_8776/g.35859 Transcript_8776/m.35859 type:complete len:346 (-) Transcript_8776:2287-3324(-)
MPSMAAALARAAATVVTRGTLNCSAERRSFLPSSRSRSSPLEMTTIMAMSPAATRSPMFGLPSCTLSTVSHGTLICLMAEAVPSVAQTSKPSDTNFSATRAMAPLLRSFTEMKMVPLLGSRCKAASSALAKAMGSVLSMPITSPVERISGPSSVSVPANLSKGSTASLTATWLGMISSVKPMSDSVLPDMTSEAYVASGLPMAFDTKGTVRLARGFASKMYTSLPPGPHLTAYWQFMSPTTPSSRASATVCLRIRSSASAGTVIAGSAHAESPLCTPACSMCSMMPPITTLPSLSASESTSISTAFSRYLSTRIGWSGSTAIAFSMYPLSWSSLRTISIARPPST